VAFEKSGVLGFRVDAGTGRTVDIVGGGDDDGPRGFRYLEQMYLEVRPPKAHGIQIDLGKFVTSAGDGYAGLSPMALNYIGGLLKHARALSAIIAPTTNSYKRLVPGYEAPANLAYSRRNRSAACRIPMYSASPKAKRVEFRPPDPASNPYLAFAAMLMAGLDGVLNKIDPGEPLDKDIYDLSPEEMKSVPSMPSSLEEALTCLEEDHEFMLKGDVFSEDLIETFIDYKRKNEADAIRLRPHPYEFALYYDI
jgi:glutamine synthetase